ncbi:MAG: DNA-binding protein [Actinobacteria bacterium]|nr:DNA-binding protein [Actinomycetota bacterium]
MVDSDLPRIGAPAIRALASIGVTRIDQLAEQSRTELLGLHGVGPRALRIIDDALAVRGLSMRP